MKSKDSNSRKSVSYQKKDGRGDKDLKVCFLVAHVIYVNQVWRFAFFILRFFWPGLMTAVTTEYGLL